MRYSMKWILAAMVYVAIAAVAFSQGAWAYGDVLWLATFIAVCYAAMLACFVPGAGRTRTGGFVIAAVFFLACLQFSPGSVPTTRIVKAVFRADTQQTTGDLVLGRSDFGPMAAIGMPQDPYSPRAMAARRDLTNVHRTANAAATMLSGLVGCLLGSLAYNRARRDALQ